jgi:aminoglycoside phosphotransferase family enzyme
VYLGISSLTRGSDGSLRIDGVGEVVDWLVRMRRLPSASMLDRALAAGTASSSCVRAVGRTLARFYAAQQRIDIQPADYVVRIADQIRADHKALAAPELQLDSTRVQLTVTTVWSAFSCLESKLSARARERRIVEAHGDLRPEHICLSDPPRVIDALEFSLDLRTLDPAEELAFLCLECDRAGGKWAGKEILSSYLQESADPVCEQLLQFYRSRRAMVRAKLVAWHLCDPLYRALAPWSELAHSYLDIATLCARQALAEPSAAGLR